MEQISINNQDDLNEIINDTSIDGQLIPFYEMLQESLTQYSEQRIEKMKELLKFVIDDDPKLYKSERKVDELSKLEVIYLYAQLP
jgi:hypothetical protein